MGADSIEGDGGLLWPLRGAWARASALCFIDSLCIKGVEKLCVLLLALELQSIPAISWVKLVKAGYNWLKTAISLKFG